VLWFQFSTVAVGLFPITIFTLTKERRRREHYEQRAKMLTAELQEAVPEPEKEILFSSQNCRERISIASSQIYFIQASDNYVSICHAEGSVKRTLLRSTLKAVEADLRGNPGFLRCHKSYIVNIDKVKRISGNAQGYKLHFETLEDVVPVARQYNSVIRERLAGYP
jgi:DNA-binding LytR/AlgR family response regulator